MGPCLPAGSGWHRLHRPIQPGIVLRWDPIPGRAVSRDLVEGRPWGPWDALHRDQRLGSMDLLVLPARTVDAAGQQDVHRMDCPPIDKPCLAPAEAWDCPPTGCQPGFESETWLVGPEVQPVAGPGASVQRVRPPTGIHLQLDHSKVQSRALVAWLLARPLDVVNRAPTCPTAHARQLGIDQQKRDLDQLSGPQGAPDACHAHR
mmetsp:Transcript_61731/g.97865  ORF Transcript_61731/g.97865 Transcript_61731/m.97865 type:complete len:204 (-) Transcript_61731:34-645(-)